jgi:hypothetical protein
LVWFLSEFKNVSQQLNQLISAFLHKKTTKSHHNCGRLCQVSVGHCTPLVEAPHMWDQNRTNHIFKEPKSNQPHIFKRQKKKKKIYIYIKKKKKKIQGRN